MTKKLLALVLLLAVFFSPVAYASKDSKKAGNIQPGMTQKDVSAEWGSPTQKYWSDSAQYPGVTTTWIYKDQKAGKRFLIYFKGDVVSEIKSENMY